MQSVQGKAKKCVVFLQRGQRQGQEAGTRRSYGVCRFTVCRYGGLGFMRVFVCGLMGLISVLIG